LQRATHANPLGVKGAGEGGIVAVGATLANAVCDAFDGLIDVRQLPLTPERVLKLSRDAEKARGGKTMLNDQDHMRSRTNWCSSRP
jgi:hypothetical protein